MTNRRPDNYIDRPSWRLPMTRVIAFEASVLVIHEALMYTDSIRSDRGNELHVGCVEYGQGVCPQGLSFNLLSLVLMSDLFD